MDPRGDPFPTTDSGISALQSKDSTTALSRSGTKGWEMGKGSGLYTRSAGHGHAHMMEVLCPLSHCGPEQVCTPQSCVVTILWSFPPHLVPTRHFVSGSALRIAG